MTIKHFLLSFLLCLTFAACKSDKKDDASSEATMEATTTKTYVTNDDVQVLWKGKYYPATIVEVGSGDQEGQFKIHYKGWSDNWDEWATADRLRDANVQDDQVTNETEN